MVSRTQWLLRRVTLRQSAASLGARFHFFFLLLAAVYTILLLCSRLLGVIPNWFGPTTLIALPATALALAVTFCRRQSYRAAARLVDRRVQTNDLFLTACLIDASIGEYKPLVLRDAEVTAPGIQPRKVVPFTWLPGARNVGLILGALFAGILLLPQLDPFGKEEQRQRVAQQRRQLQENRKATALRAALLKAKGADADLSEQVAKAVGELKQTFSSVKSDDKQGNLKRITENQAKLGELWQKATEKKLDRALRPIEGSQRFGEDSSQKTEQWQQELKEGSSASLKKEIADIKEAVRRLAESRDQTQRKKLEAQVKKKLEQLKDFAAQQSGAGPVNSALERALEQLAMTDMEGLSSEALQGLQESLQLTELELDSLAQSLADLRALEDALKALQLAKLLNGFEPLDGAACSACQGMGDYVALYAKLMAGRCCKCGGILGPGGVCPSCRAIGLGMRGPGIGVGNVAPENAAAEVEFKTEKSRSALTAGKILLSIKVQGLSDPGQAVRDYQQCLQDVKQGVSEAILHEQVPAAYHDAIRKYFDSLEKADEGIPAQ